MFAAALVVAVIVYLLTYVIEPFERRKRRRDFERIYGKVDWEERDR